MATPIYESENLTITQYYGGHEIGPQLQITTGLEGYKDKIGTKEAREIIRAMERYLYRHDRWEANKAERKPTVQRVK